MAAPQGVWTALVTPFKDDGSIDEAAFRRIVESQIDAGIDGVIPCGTTGESPTLNADERKKVIQLSLEICKGSATQVYAGTGSNSTQASVDFSKWASDAGVAGILVIAPYYNKPTQEGLYQHFSAIADAIDCDLMLYNAPGRTVISIQPPTVVRLAAHKNITSIKDATGGSEDPCLIQGELKKAKTKLQILTGDDANYLPVSAVGGKGVVSVASNVIPKQMISLRNAIQNNELADAQEQFVNLYPFFKALFVESNPVPVKFALSLLGLCSADVRLPLAPLSENSQAAVTSEMKRLELL